MPDGSGLDRACGAALPSAVRYDIGRRVVLPFDVQLEKNLFRATGVVVVCSIRNIP